MLSVTCLHRLLYSMPADVPIAWQNEQEHDQPMAGSTSSSGSQPPVHPATGAAAAAVPEADSTHAPQKHNQASTAADPFERSVHGSHLLQQQQQHVAQEEEGAFQSQQLLLVGSKVTGDRNVPAGQVTFAVDLGSRSREGAGRLLQLPPGVHTAVEVNGPGTRPFVVKVRASMFLCACWSAPAEHAVEPMASLQGHDFVLSGITGVRGAKIGL